VATTTSTPLSVIITKTTAMPDVSVEDFVKLATETLAKLNPTQLGELSADQVAALPVASLAALKQVNLSTDVISAISVENITGLNIRSLTPNQFNALTLIQLGVLSVDQVKAISTAQFTAISSDNIAGFLPKGNLLAIDVKKIPLVVIAGLTVEQIAGLADSQLAALSPTQVAALTSDQTAVITPTQAKALAPNFIKYLSGNGIANLSSASIAAISPNSFSAITNLDALTDITIQALTSAQVNSLSAAKIDTFSDAYNIQYLSIAALAGLDKKNMLGLDVTKLTVDQFTALTPAQLSLLSTAATGNQADQIAALSNDQVAALTVNQAKGASAAFFKALAADDVAKLSDVAVAAIAPKSLITMTHFAGLTSDNLGLISSAQVNALTLTQIATMSGSDNDIQYISEAALAGLDKKNIVSINLEALTSDQFASLTADQLNAAAIANSANITGVAAITADEIAALTPKQAKGLGTAFAAALDATQVSKLSPEAVAALAPKTFAAIDADLSGLTSDNAILITSAQINALTSTQITAISVTNLDLQYVSPAALLGLDKKNIQGLTHLVTSGTQVLSGDQFAALKPAQVQLLPNSAIADLTGADNVGLLNAATFSVLSSAQIAQLPTATFATIPESSFGALTAKTIVSLTDGSSAASDVSSTGNNQIHQLSAEQAAFLTPDAVKGLRATQIDGGNTYGLTSAAFAAINPVALKAMLPAALVAIADTTFAGITPEQLAVLSTAQVKVLTNDQISKLDAEDAATLTPAQVVVWNSTQASHLAEVAIKALIPDALAKLSIANFSATQIGYLSNEQVLKLTATQMALLNEDSLSGALTADQIAGVKTLNSIPSGNFDHLDTAVVAALEIAQISKFDKAHLEAFTVIQAAKFNSDVVDWAYSKGYSVISSANSSATALKGITTGTTVSGNTIYASTITAGKTAVSITGGAASDSITGGQAADIIDGGSAVGSTTVDSIDGGAGDDVIVFRSTYDIIEGGEGTKDTLKVNGTYAATNDVDANLDGVEIVNINTGIAVNGFAVNLTNQTEGFVINLLAASADVSTTKFTITGSAGDDSITGASAGDVILGSNGDDTISGGTAGSDTITGGAGDDVFNFVTGSVNTQKVTILDFGNGSDSFKGALTGAGSIDVTIFGTSTTPLELSKVLGTGGISSVTGGSAADTITGGAGSDTINGGGGDDSINGGAGIDSLTGGAGNDTLTGGVGADVFVVDAGTDIITDWGTLGSTDTLAISVGATAIFTVPTAGGDVTFGGTTTVTSNSGTLIVDASSAKAVTLIGTSGVNKITGSEFADSITGGSVDDTIFGGNGNDTINGGEGFDVITLGTGNDIVVLGITATSIDTIIGFVGGSSHDKIQLNGTTAAVGKSVAQLAANNAGFEKSIAFDTAVNLGALGVNLGNHVSATYLLKYAVAKDTGVIYYDADGDWLTGSVQVGSIGNVSDLTAEANFTINYIDTIIPLVLITSSVPAVKVGETATITATFSEAVIGFTVGDLVSSNGAFSNFVTIDSSHFTATFTPTAISAATSAAITIAAGSYTDIATNSGGAGTTPTLLMDMIIPSVTNTSGVYTSSTDTLVLTGTNFNSLLETGESSSTDIKALLDWSKLSWKIDGNSSLAGVDFILSDISSVKVTDSNHMTVVFTSIKGKALEVTSSFGGTILDTLDIKAGFARDFAGNVATTDGAANEALSISVGVQPVIDLGSNGKLIAPIQLLGKVYYFWDKSGDGSAGASDYMNHNFLDDLFNKNINGVVNPVFNQYDHLNGTTDTYRYGTINGVQLAIATGSAVNHDYSLQPGGQYLDIWTAYNVPDYFGVPPGWADKIYYWTATPGLWGHYLFALFALKPGEESDDDSSNAPVILELIGSDTVSI
jgi:hypothetical protein